MKHLKSMGMLVVLATAGVAGVAGAQELALRAGVVVAMQPVAAAAAPAVGTSSSRCSTAWLMMPSASSPTQPPPSDSTDSANQGLTWSTTVIMKVDLVGVLWGLGAAVGQALGRDSAQSYQITRAAMTLGADVAGNGAGAAAAGEYLVMIRFADASEAAFKREASALGSLRVGSRVKVAGTGTAALIVEE